MLHGMQDRLTRVRPPRVKITYDVETGGALEAREVPFIAAIFADLFGDRTEELPPVGERRLVEIDRDNFDDVMTSIAPRMELLGIPGKMPGPGIALLEWYQNWWDATQSGAENATPRPAPDGLLEFAKMDDFRPEGVLKNVPLLAAWYQRRRRLREYQAELEGAEAFTRLVEGILHAVNPNPPPAPEGEAGSLAMVVPTQVAITDQRENELNDLGFIALCHCEGTNKAAFLEGEATYRLGQGLTPDAIANATLPLQLPCLLTASRFAQHIKVIMRGKAA